MASARLYPEERRRLHPLLWALLGNLALAALKVGVGLSESSRLVLADGLFSLMSVTVLLLPWQAEVLQKKELDERYPYGLGKLLFMSTAMVGLLGLVIAVNTFLYSLRPPGWMEMRRSAAAPMMVTLTSIMANSVLYRYLMDKSRRHSSVFLALAARYNRIDFWISSFVLALLILGGLGVMSLERLGTLVIAIAIFVVGASTVYAGLSGIMDKVPSQAIVERIRSCVRKVGEVREVLNVRARYMGTLLHIDAWIAVDEHLSMEQANGIALNVKRQLLETIPLAKEVNVIIA